MSLAADQSSAMTVADHGGSVTSFNGNPEASRTASFHLGTLHFPSGDTQIDAAQN